MDIVACYCFWWRFPSCGIWSRLVYRNQRVRRVRCKEKWNIIIEEFGGVLVVVVCSGQDCRWCSLVWEVKDKREMWDLFSITTYSMEQSLSWEANRFLSESKFSLHRTQKFITAFTSACHLSLRAPPSHFLKIHYNIIFPPTPEFSQWPLSVWFPCVLNVSPISFLLIWSPIWYLMRSTDH